jgi:hypothetical protein
VQRTRCPSCRDVRHRRQHGTSGTAGAAHALAGEWPPPRQSPEFTSVTLPMRAGLKRAQDDATSTHKCNRTAIAPINAHTDRTRNPESRAALAQVCRWHPSDHGEHYIHQVRASDRGTGRPSSRGGSRTTQIQHRRRLSRSVTACDVCVRTACACTLAAVVKGPLAAPHVRHTSARAHGMQASCRAPPWPSWVSCMTAPAPACRAAS